MENPPRLFLGSGLVPNSCISICIVYSTIFNLGNGILYPKLCGWWNPPKKLYTGENPLLHGWLTKGMKTIFLCLIWSTVFETLLDPKKHLKVNSYFKSLSCSCLFL